MYQNTGHCCLPSGWWFALQHRKIWLLSFTCGLSMEDIESYSYKGVPIDVRIVGVTKNGSVKFRGKAGKICKQVTVIQNIWTWGNDFALNFKCFNLQGWRSDLLFGWNIAANGNQHPNCMQSHIILIDRKCSQLDFLIKNPRIKQNFS